MENLTLGQFVDQEEDAERKALLQEKIAEAKALSGRASFDDVQIRSVSEMGEAAGTCHMCTGEIKLREDIVSSEAAIREKLAHVLVHEAEHAKGNGLEGLTELETSLKTGKPPVPAYVQKVEHARHITSVVGHGKALNAAKVEKGNVVLLQAYVAARVKSGMNAVVAQNEGEDHIRMAA